MDTDIRVVRERAYLIWETEGRPHGRDLEHWLRAERELTIPHTAPAPEKKRRRAPAAKARSTSPRSPARKKSS